MANRKSIASVLIFAGSALCFLLPIRNRVVRRRNSIYPYWAAIGDRDHFDSTAAFRTASDAKGQPGPIRRSGWFVCARGNCTQPNRQKARKCGCHQRRRWCGLAADNEIQAE